MERNFIIWGYIVTCANLYDSNVAAKDIGEHLPSLVKDLLLLALVEGGHHELHGRLVHTEQPHQVRVLEEYLVVHDLTTTSVH